MSIHPLNDIDSYKAKIKPESMFMNALGFTEDDLADNQQLKMSVNQRVLCLTKRNWWLFSGILCVLGFLIVWFGGRELSLFLVGFVIGILVCSLNIYRLHQDATKEIAISVEGRINLVIRGRRFSIMVDGMKFDLKQQEFLAFKNGDPYRIYYSPLSKVLLSAEWLRD